MLKSVLEESVAERKSFKSHDFVDTILSNVLKPLTFGPPKKAKSPAVMASGHGLPARVHNIMAPEGADVADFSRAAMQTMLILHSSRPEGKKLYSPLKAVCL